MIENNKIEYSKTSFTPTQSNEYILLTYKRHHHVYHLYDSPLYNGYGDENVFNQFVKIKIS